MNGLSAALWAEALKARCSKVSHLSAVGFSILPVVSGLFMVILKDPEAARSMGLISMKSQLIAGAADWPTHFEVLLQGMAIAGPILFAFITAWIFGREFADYTVKELLAIPTPRATVVAAKFVVLALWVGGLSVMIFALGLGVGALVRIPGWSIELGWSSFWSLQRIVLVGFMLMPFVALFASLGRGYLPALAWAFFTLVLAQIVSVLGWGDWFPWSVPVLISGMAGEGGAEQIGIHSYILVLAAFVLGIGATVAWWRRADQAR
jgi:ABC-2 type transport system permease protein